MKRVALLILSIIVLGSVWAPSSDASPGKASGPPRDVFTTRESRFNPGAKNQGWWSSTIPAQDWNDNYLVGITSDGAEYRNFFSFDLSDLSGPVIAARLILSRFGTSGDPSETFTLYDVRTPAAILNETSASIPRSSPTSAQVRSTQPGRSRPSPNRTI